MPGWHDATQELQRQGKVQMLGIIQEQHPDRCRLFMQWKQMDWPILVDSQNLLEVTAVPITLAIDEFGIVRAKGLRLDRAEEIEESFLDPTFDPPTELPDAGSPRAPDLARLQRAAENGTAADLRRYAADLLNWTDEGRWDEVIAAYQQALSLEPEHGPTHFRLGVAFRKRYDSPRRQPQDFASAVEHWKKALDIDPNQYIWRRRIQQYGPRLDKPYPFYDWVSEARREIEARGGTPAPLVVEPGGAEFAHPQKTFESISEAQEQPDSRGRIHRDEEGFVLVETTVVPPVVTPGEAARVHVVFRPNEQIKAHWNNEVDGLAYWVDPPQGWALDRHLLTTPNPPETVSLETRKIEFEVRCPEDASAGEQTLSSYALYYVCEDVNGTCLYRRQDIAIPLAVRQPAQ